MSNKRTITRQTKLGEIIEKHSKAAKILAEKYNFHCLGCFAAALESLEEGARAHGMKNEEIDEMVNELNEKTELNN